VAHPVAGADLHAGLVDLVLQRRLAASLAERLVLRLERVLNLLAAAVARALHIGVATVDLDIALQGLDALVGAARTHERRDQREAGGAYGDGSEQGIDERAHL